MKNIGVGLFLLCIFSCQQNIQAEHKIKEVKITQLTLTIRNLPENIQPGEKYSLVGTFNNWDPASSTSTVSNDTLAFPLISITNFDTGVKDWQFSSARANSAFRIVHTLSGATVLASDFPDQEGSFRLRLVKDRLNQVQIDAGGKNKVDQDYALSLNKKTRRKAGDINPRLFCFPGGKDKALVMSFDDGNIQDRKLIALFNKYRIKGTFHLNSGKLGQPNYITRAEVKTLFQGHEVSGHSVTHPNLTKIPLKQAGQEIREDVATLTDLCGYKLSGISYPFGTYNQEIIRLLSEQGLLYARTIAQTGDFGLPRNLLKWETSCHHSQANALASKFLSKKEKELALFFVWGHSWELDKNLPQNSWSDMEKFCALMGEHPEIWKATANEVALYLLALKRLTLTDNIISNPPDNREVWVRWKEKVFSVRPGKSLILD